MASFDMRPDDLLQTTVNGRWRVTGWLGAGPGAQVFAADEVVDRVLVRTVALRLVVPEGNDAESAWRPDLTALTEVRHANLLAVEAVGQVSNGPAAGHLFLTQPLADETLRTADISQLALIVTEVAAGLAAWHDAGRVHGHLSVSNVVRVGAQWKVADAGLIDVRPTRVVQAWQRRRRLWSLPPEVLAGQVDTALDVWSLGVALVERFEGRPLWGEGTLSDLLRAMAVGQTEPLPRLPPPLDVLAQGCLMRPVARRWTIPMIRTALRGGRVETLPAAEARRKTRPRMVASEARLECRSEVQALAGAPGGRWVVGCADGSLRLVEADRKTTSMLGRLPRGVTSVAVCGERVLAGSGAGALLLGDLVGPRQHLSLTGPVLAVGLQPEGGWCLCDGGQLYRIGSDGQVVVAVIPLACSLAVSQRSVAVGTLDGRVARLDSGWRLQPWHQGAVSSLGFAGDELVSASTDLSLGVRSEQVAVSMGVLAMAVGGGQVTLVGEGGTLVSLPLPRLLDDLEAGPFRSLQGLSGRLNAVAVDGPVVAAGGREGRIGWWRLEPVAGG